MQTARVHVLGVVLRGPVSPDDACRDIDERRAHLGHSQELRRRRQPAAVLRQSHHLRLVDASSQLSVSLHPPTR